MCICLKLPDGYFVARYVMSFITFKDRDVVRSYCWTTLESALKHMCCCCYCVTSVVSDSVWPHRRQPTRIAHLWDSPGKNIGVGCHFLLQCMKVKSEREVAQSCPTLCDPRDWSLPGSSVHGIFQARVLEWGAIAFSTNTCVVYSKFLNFWINREKKTIFTTSSF